MTNKRMDTEGVFHRYDPSAVEDDDVEGHGSKYKAPEDVTRSRAAEDDDVEAHGSKYKAPEDVTRSRTAEDDDVEGHSIGTMNPVLARDLARAKERDIQRATSRNNLISEVKRALRRKD